MKIEVVLQDHPKDTHEGERLQWEFIDGHVEILNGVNRLATYRLDQVLWVKRVDQVLLPKVVDAD